MGLIRINNKMLSSIVIILIVAVFTLTVAYAALSVSLNILGSAEVVASNWDIHLDNVNVTNGSVNATTEVRIDSSSTASFAVDFTTPGEFYEFTIDIVNNGSIDAMIDSIIKSPNFNVHQAKLFLYDITYEDGSLLNEKQILLKKDKKTLKVRIEYRKDISASDLPTSKQTLSLSFKVNYLQADNSASSSLVTYASKIKVLSGDITTKGSEVAIGDEHFYVVSNDGTNVVLLTKYNLYTGYSHTNAGSVLISNPTGKQDASARGWHEAFSDSNPIIGAIPFASTNYWYGLYTSFSAYVYNSNSYLYEHVENYKTYLENEYLSKIGERIIEARLIKNSELEGLNCSMASSSCANAPSWVYYTTYWTGDAISDHYMWMVASYSGFGYRDINDSSIGIRPVIVLKSSIFS